jgi:hypothetical protein
MMYGQHDLAIFSTGSLWQERRLLEHFHIER